MLAQSSHGFKGQFLQVYKRDAPVDRGRLCKQRPKYLAAVSGPCAGGGYELAMACDEIVLIDDGSSTVALPEVPLFGVLPGTGGLTRLVDKRKVRRDRADIFFDAGRGHSWQARRRVASRRSDGAAQPFCLSRERSGPQTGTRVEKPSRQRTRTADGDPPSRCIRRSMVTRFRIALSRCGWTKPHRTAHLTMRGPGTGRDVRTSEELHALASRGELWALRAYRELDDAICRLRFHYPTVGLVMLSTRGDQAEVLKADAAVAALRDYGWAGKCCCTWRGCCVGST